MLEKVTRPARVFLRDPGGFLPLVGRVNGSGPMAKDGDTGEARLLTVSEACTRLRISKWTLYELIRKRQLETIRIGRRRLIPAISIAMLLERLLREESL
jgi:excisionase family DNA binding protein